MTATEWKEYLRKRLAEAERELAGFESAVAKYGLRVWHRDVHGEREMTEQSRWHLKAVVEEYGRLLRDD